MGSGLVSLLYLNSPFLFTEDLMYTFSTDLMLSAIFFILGQNLEILVERYSLRGVIYYLLELASPGKGNFSRISKALDARALRIQEIRKYS